MDDIIRCPYRKITTEYTHDGLRETEETFPQCYGTTCPVFDARRKICKRAFLEKMQTVTFKELGKNQAEERMSIWAN